MLEFSTSYGVVLCGMRVIAGTYRGRRLYGPQTQTLRPTSDRVREALFSILGNRLPHSRFLDLYAGTGAVGIEALSRGADHVTAVESDKDAVKLLQRNKQLCQIGSELTIQPHAVEQFLRRPDQWNGPYDVVFADPPYAETTGLSSLLSQSLTGALFAEDAWLVVEHGGKTTVPAALGPTSLRRQYRYGDTMLSLYSS
ncbi:putative Ribosomal RNA small subunit methyltransferase D [Candidatus Nitrospira nitrosa]|uniref:Putative Ribosomal RNA small subunit methyltransferase D n=2 Tax=Candidatus Nitrospira nitrosa TaxID=1742972 RepID=A0A0S4LFI9_9BACT|nr:putative Ribosomal RNA small subunit methyltransferase D [Candidatus Nitrospira nitrosa]